MISIGNVVLIGIWCLMLGIFVGAFIERRKIDDYLQTARKAIAVAKDWKEYALSKEAELDRLTSEADGVEEGIIFTSDPLLSVSKLGGSMYTDIKPNAEVGSITRITQTDAKTGEKGVCLGKITDIIYVEDSENWLIIFDIVGEEEDEM